MEDQFWWDDPYFYGNPKFDWEAAVKFWCPDLAVHGPELGLLSLRTSSGRVVAKARMRRALWIKALSVIYDHLVKVREERSNASGD